MNERIKELAEQTDITMTNVYACYEKHIERFAELVRQDEREACAKVCEEENWSYAMGNIIRARGDKHD